MQSLTGDVRVTFGFLAQRRSYLDHLVPVWRALGEAEREGFVVPAPTVHVYARSLGLELSGAVKPGNWVVASQSSYACALRKHRAPVVYLEHGVGILGVSRGLNRVALHCCPNEFVARGYRAHSPAARVEVIGTPKMDDLLTASRPHDGTVAVAFHWPSTSAPNGPWAFPRYHAALIRLASTRRIIGHGHPRAWNKLRAFYLAMGVEPVEHFADVVARADVLVADNSSVLFEWAALDRPVVHLVGQHRSELLRRYEVGLQCRNPNELASVIGAATEDPAEARELRKRTTEDLYPYLGHATERAVEVLRSHVSFR